MFKCMWYVDVYTCIMCVYTMFSLMNNRINVTVVFIKLYSKYDKINNC